MAYQKKYATEAERRLAQAAGGRKGAAGLKASGNYYRGGRPKGTKNKNSLGGTPTKNLSLRVPAYNIFTRCAAASNRSLADLMSLVADGLKEKNPQLFLKNDNVTI